MHVDVNNAFLSWSAIDLMKQGSSVDIRLIPSVICGDESRRAGIILAKSPIAKAMGVITGETIYQAMRKCPRLKVYPTNFKAYKKYSDMLYKLLLEYTDLIERFSIDECFLDMTNFLAGNTIMARAIEINKRVKEELGFTVNIGISNNKVLAKMASDFSKPDKIHTLYPDEIKDKMWDLDVSELFMIGRKSVPKLKNMGINTIGDLAKSNESFLIKKLGKFGKLIWEYANGIDNSEVIAKREKPKSIGNSITLALDFTNKEKLETILLSLVEQVSYRLRKEKLLAQVACVQLRTKDFKDFSHQSKLPCATSSAKEIYKKAKSIFDEMYIYNIPIRLVGFRVDNLVSEDNQLSFFDDGGKNVLDETIDGLKEKYGYSTITKASEIGITKSLKID